MSCSSPDCEKSRKESAEALKMVFDAFQNVFSACLTEISGVRVETNPEHRRRHRCDSWDTTNPTAKRTKPSNHSEDQHPRPSTSNATHRTAATTRMSPSNQDTVREEEGELPPAKNSGSNPVCQKIRDEYAQPLEKLKDDFEKIERRCGENGTRISGTPIEKNK
uniref:Uncharacterized protein n=1 Tax=Glossina pallidipes TaxID=7398 RepID=A0A1B0A0H2_GLOPL